MPNSTFWYWRWCKIAFCGVLRRFAVFCGVLRRIAAFCGVLPRFAAFCGELLGIAANCGGLRRFAANYGVLRHIAAFCRVLPRFAAFCRVLPRFAAMRSCFSALTVPVLENLFSKRSLTLRCFKCENIVIVVIISYSWQFFQNGKITRYSHVLCSFQLHDQIMGG